MEEIVLTEEGLQKYKDELEQLVTVRRKEIIDMIAHARSLGDLSENSEYDEAKELQGRTESRISELQEIIKHAKLVDKSTFDDNVINIGDHVVVYDETFEENEEFDIVGSTEANVFDGKISDQSPIGKALVGKKVGETVSVDTPSGEMKLKILEFKKND